MLVIKAKITGMEALLDSLEKALNDEMPAVMTKAAEIVRQEVQKDHKFQNHTYNLERSLKSKKGTGRLRTVYKSVVYSLLGYSGYVEDKVTSKGSWSYFKPALNRCKNTIENLLGAALTRAARKAKMK